VPKNGKERLTKRQKNVMPYGEDQKHKQGCQVGERGGGKQIEERKNQILGKPNAGEGREKLDHARSVDFYKRRKPPALDKSLKNWLFRKGAIAVAVGGPQRGEALGAPF